MTLTIRCRTCGNTATLVVKDSDYMAWRNGMLIQHAFPYLSAGDRELLISNTCDACFERLTGDLE